ncbi:unnamed protein product, partial [Polarella glacialis]
MDVNAPAFVPGGLSAHAKEFVPCWASSIAPAGQGLSSQAPEFVPGNYPDLSSNIRPQAESVLLGAAPWIGAPGTLSTGQSRQTGVPGHMPVSPGAHGASQGVEVVGAKVALDVLFPNLDWDAPEAPAPRQRPSGPAAPQ